MFGSLLMLERKPRREGGLIFAFAGLYSAGRFFLEFLRGDPRGYYFNHLLSTSQLIGLFIIPLAIFLLFHLFEQHKDLQGSGFRTVRSARVRKVGVRT